MLQKIGFGKAEITPPLGTLLAGYAERRPADSVHDPLYCKAVLLEIRGKRFGLLVFDLVGTDEALCRKIRARVGMGEDEVVICAIHTHSGPQGAFSETEGALAKLQAISGPENKEYIAYLVEQSAKAFEAAAECMESFSLRIGRGEVPPIGSERHTGSAPDGQLTVLEFITQSARRLLVYSFPCHPTVMGPQSMAVTADFPAFTAEKLKCDMGVFVNAACGDISTRFVRRESDFEECRRLGVIAAEAIERALENQPQTAPTDIKALGDTVMLKARVLQTVEEADRMLRQFKKDVEEGIARGADRNELRLLRTYVEGAQTNLMLSRVFENVTEFAIPISAFSFAGIVFVTIPGELFSTLRLRGGEVIIGYANGYNMYFPDVNAYKNGYYEAMCSVYAQGECEKLMAAAGALAERLK